MTETKIKISEGGTYCKSKDTSACPYRSRGCAKTCDYKEKEKDDTKKERKIRGERP